MTYHGFEIFFQALGNADSIFVRHYINGAQTNILIDGGRRSHAEAVRSFLRSLGETQIHHLVCSHHHDDHAGGLIELVKDTSLTFHQAWVHTEEIVADKANLAHYEARGYKKLVDVLRASKETQVELIAALKQQAIPMAPPFAGAQVGPLLILSPSKDFYNAQLQRIQQEAVAQALNDRYLKRQLNNLFDVFSGGQTLFGKAAEEKEEEEGALGGEPTSPENEVSTVIFLNGRDFKTGSYLFTADAGTEALSSVKAISERFSNLLSRLTWMQLPHHGSRRNLNEDLLDHFKPTTAFVSAEGSVKHPSKKLVNAVKDRGGKVFSTHYPNNDEAKGHWLRKYEGTVPDISTSPAVPLYDAP
jgi:beta-lactamase superfamily II metal-dependent hydrolase